MRTTSLGQEVSFTQILPLLNVPVRTTVLPAILSCPCCQGNRLHVYRDSVEQQDWFYCRGCKTAGDMIELAAAAWKLDLPSTIRKLLESNVPLGEHACLPDTVAGYLKDHVKFRARLRQFWKEIQGYTRQNEMVVQEVFRSLGLPIPSGEWLRRASQLVGVSNREMVKQYMTGTDDGPRKGKLPRHALTGDGWNFMLVLPYYDLPGHMCGILLAGLDKRRQPSLAFFPIAGASASREAGLAMLDNVTLPPHQAFGRALFVLTDPFAALRMQLRHLRESEIPLPVTAAYTGTNAQTVATWQNLKHEEVICWSPTGGLEAVIQAKRADAAVSTLVTTDTALAGSVTRQTPGDWLHRVKRAATHWQLDVRRRLREQSREDVESTILSLEMSHQQYEQFVRDCDPELQARLEGIRDHVGTIRQVKCCNKVVCEQAGRWQVDDELICDAIVRIEQVITSRRGRTYYKGLILFNDQEVPFLDRSEEIERRGFEWLQHHLTNVAHAGVIHYSLLWTKRLANLAMLFHKPDLIRGVEQIGWDDARLRFQFPKFAILPGGELDTSLHCLYDHAGIPARLAPLPDGDVASSVLRSLSERHDEGGLVWATAAAVAANLLAPAINQEPRGVLLDGDGAQAVGSSAAILMGCPELHKAAQDSIIALVQEKLDPHTWPAVLRNQPNRSLDPGLWLTTPEARRLIVSLPETAVQVLGLRQSWHVIRCGRSLGSLQLTAESVPAILPHYLRDVCERRFLSTGGAALVTLDDVLVDMAAWFGRAGGDVAAVRDARDYLQPAGATPPCDFFVRLVAYAAGYEEVFVGREQINPEADVLYLADEPQVWISQSAVSNTAREYGHVPLDALLATKVLMAEGALIAETRRHGMLGWLLHRDWWDTRWKKLVSKD